ncbi:hypothetical protein PM082_023438 [Marasmius tenuissimus]|nr:hypothetical protein PM082_023438 [Marasmius tenuissimus]
MLMDLSSKVKSTRFRVLSDRMVNFLTIAQAFAPEIAEYLSPADVARFSAVNHVFRAGARSMYWRRYLTLLGRYLFSIDNCQAFRALQRRSGSVIVGLVVVFFLNGGYSPEVDLDILCSAESASDLQSFLERDVGYRAMGTKGGMDFEALSGIERACGLQHETRGRKINIYNAWRRSSDEASVHIQKWMCRGWGTMVTPDAPFVVRTVSEYTSQRRVGDPATWTLVLDDSEFEGWSIFCNTWNHSMVSSKFALMFETVQCHYVGGVYTTAEQVWNILCPGPICALNFEGIGGAENLQLIK